MCTICMQGFSCKCCMKHVCLGSLSTHVHCFTFYMLLVQWIWIYLCDVYWRCCASTSMLILKLPVCRVSTGAVLLTCKGSMMMLLLYVCVSYPRFLETTSTLMFHCVVYVGSPQVLYCMYKGSLMMICLYMCVSYSRCLVFTFYMCHGARRSKLTSVLLLTCCVFLCLWILVL